MRFRLSLVKKSIEIGSSRFPVLYGRNSPTKNSIKLNSVRSSLNLDKHMLSERPISRSMVTIRSVEEAVVCFR